MEGIRVLGELMATAPGMTLTRRRCRDFWGSRLEHLPRRARNKLIEVPHFKEHCGRSFFYHTSDIVFELGMATYSGSGKYTDDDVVVFWNNIPEDADDEVEPVCSRTAAWWRLVCADRRRERIDAFFWASASSSFPCGTCSVTISLRGGFASPRPKAFELRKLS